VIRRRITIKLPIQQRGLANELSAKLHEAERVVWDQAPLFRGTHLAMSSWIKADQTVQVACKNFLDLFREKEPNLPDYLIGWVYDRVTGTFSATF
jgi:hypothetical protein